MADQTIYQTEKSMENLNGQAPEAMKQEVQSKIAELQEALKGEDSARIRQLTQEVQQASMAIGQAAYSQTNETAAPNATSHNPEGEEDIVEGEFEAA
jgi:molecular chaperone DnaK